MNITIRTRIRPTEDENKVRIAVHALFPGTPLVREGDELIGGEETLEALSTLKTHIERQAIRDTARKKLRQGTFSGAITFHLNKQAAYVGKVNFSNEAPLGPITVRIVADPETIIDYLAPSTIGEATAQNASIPDNNEGYHEMEKN